MTDQSAPHAVVSHEATLLCDAMGIEQGSVREISREPLGTGVVAGFEVDDGAQTATMYVDTSHIAVERESGLVQEGVARIWTHPADPHLPALAAVAFGTAAQTLLSRLGIQTSALPDFVAYRPGRRAVLRIDVGGEVLWLKVVRPRHVDRIVEAHSALGAAGVSVPAVRAWAPFGLLIIDAAHGTLATEAAWTPAGLVDAVDEVRAQCASALIDRPVRSPVLTRVGWYCDRVSSLNPGLHDRVERVRQLLANTPNSYETVVHGDLHFGQLFLDDSAQRITGVVDVDTAGRGDSAEDPAAFISHAVASAELARSTPAGERVGELVTEAARRWGTEPAVRGRVAAQLLGHTASALERGEDERSLRLLGAVEAWAIA